MMRQVVASTGGGDQASAVATLLQPSLGPVYAPHSGAGVTPPTEWRDDDSPVCFHASPGAPEAYELVAAQRGPVVVVTHGLPSPERVRPYDAAFAERLETCEAALRHIAKRTRVALATSPSDAELLGRLGYPKVRLVVAPVDVPALQTVESHPPTAHHLATQVTGPLVAFVAPLLPDARVELVIEAFHVLATYVRPDVNLAVVGPSPVARYGRALQLLVHELNLASAWLTGPAAEAERVAYYRASDVVVATGTEPMAMLEAMALDVPVVAAAETGLTDSALTLPSGGDVLLLAEAIAAVLDDAALRERLVRRGRRRADNDHLAALVRHVRQAA